MGADTVGTGGRGTDRGPEDQVSRGAPSLSPGAAARDPHRGRPQGGPALAHLAPRCCAQSSRSGGSSQASASMASAGGALGRGRRRGPAVAGAREVASPAAAVAAQAGGSGRARGAGARADGARNPEPPRPEPGRAPRAGRPAPQLGPPRLPRPAPSASPFPKAAVPRGVWHAPSGRHCPCRPQTVPPRVYPEATQAKDRVDATSRCRPDACGPTGAAGPPPWEKLEVDYSRPPGAGSG